MKALQFLSRLFLTSLLAWTGVFIVNDGQAEAITNLPPYDEFNFEINDKYRGGYSSTVEFMQNHGIGTDKSVMVKNPNYIVNSEKTFSITWNNTVIEEGETITILAEEDDYFGDGTMVFVEAKSNPGGEKGLFFDNLTSGALNVSIVATTLEATLTNYGLQMCCGGNCMRAKAGVINKNFNTDTDVTGDKKHIPFQYDVDFNEKGNYGTVKTKVEISAGGQTLSFYVNFVYNDGFLLTENKYVYSGRIPDFKWVCSKEGYRAIPDFSNVPIDVGDYRISIPVTFMHDTDEPIKEECIISYSIKPATLTVVVPNAVRVYGEENPIFEITKFIGFKGEDNESVIISYPVVYTSAKADSDVGEYPITITGGNARNYTFMCEPGILSIIKAPLTARVNDISRHYGTSNPKFTVYYSGLKNGETEPKWSTQLTFETMAEIKSDVGIYELKAFGVPVNYDLPYIEKGTLTITQAPLTLRAKDVTRQYYSDNPEFGYYCYGLLNGDNTSVLLKAPVFYTAATLNSDVGIYDITLSDAESKNYAITYEKGNLSITSRMLNVSVGNYERVYNEENPVFEVIYEGFVGSDSESSLITPATTYTSATKNSNVGTYTIQVTGANAKNYTFTYSPGILTINKANQEIIWDQEFDNVSVGDQIELTAYSTSGLTLSYILSDNTIAEIYSVGDKIYLDCIKEGTLNISARQDGNGNYYSAIRKSKNIQIGNTNGIGIVSLESLSPDDLVYDMTGMRVFVLHKNRLYIYNGKKILVK